MRGTRPHLAFGADEAAHVLHHPDDGQLHLVAEADLFPNILERHFLLRFQKTGYFRVWAQTGTIMWWRYSCRAAASLP